MRSLVPAVVGVLMLGAASRVSATSPAVVFIVLDTTRADRFSALGNPRNTTPALDALARSGVLFRRHFANSHATRPSFPQFMTGRYYHQNILRDFMPDAHPREMSFSRADPTAILLPQLLRDHGYQILGVSAHLWVAPASRLGATFEKLDTLANDPQLGFVDADHVVDRGATLWRERDTTRPTFLYLHFMDMHIPRFDRADRFRIDVPNFDWQARFEPNGEPTFDRERRRWSPDDARDFTARDREYMTAVYDGHLARTDAALGRLLDLLRQDDPGLAHTLVVVVADHGEQLGEDGQMHHNDTLADGIQHIPWIMAGAGLAPQQSCAAVTEHVDVLPTLLRVLHLDAPAGTTTDGVPRIDEHGRLTEPCGGTAAYYAWEDYRAVRRHHYLLEQRAPGSPRAHCQGGERLYRIDEGGRLLLRGPNAQRRLRRMRAALRDRLAAREASFLSRRYADPAASFLLRTDFWALDPAASVGCTPFDSETPRSVVREPGWLWSGRGFTVFDANATQALPLTIRVPSSTYVVEAATLPMARPPWLFGFGRWLRRAFVPDVPSAFVPLGTMTVTNGELAIQIPADAGRGRHVVGLRLTPPGSAPSSRPVGDGERERLKALGYVQ
jgi:arylsulfatase A-like enzyme